MPTITIDRTVAPDTKAFNGALPLASELALAIHRDLQELGVEPQKDFEVQGGQEKFWGIVAQAAAAVAPHIIRALTKQGYGPDQGLGAEEEMLWDAAQKGLTAVMPVLHNEMLEAGIRPEDLADLDVEKGWLSTLGRIAAAGVEIAVEVLRTRGPAPKGFELQPVDQKRWWAQIKPIMTSVASGILSHLAKTGVEPQKDFAGTQEKLFGGLVSGAIRAARMVYNRLRTKQLDIQKDFEGEATFYAALETGLRLAGPLVTMGMADPTKAFENGVVMAPATVDPVDEVDEKVFNILGRLIPAIITRLTR